MTSNEDTPKEDSKSTEKMDVSKEIRETQQEMILDLKLRTDALFKKFKKLQDGNRVKFGRM